MKAEYFNEKDAIDISTIEQVANGILEGKSVVFPTETVYGIGANALDEEACEKVFEIKGRPTNKPLIVLISNLNMLDDISVSINETERKLMERFWPGPLTIILSKRKESVIPAVVTAGQDNIGIRMTSGKIANLLIQKAGVPIVAPSANLSGNPTGIKMRDIIKELGGKVDYILDCGDIESSTTSTVVRVKDEVIYILRQGKIKKEQLEEIAKVQII